MYHCIIVGESLYAVPYSAVRALQNVNVARPHSYMHHDNVGTYKMDCDNLSSHHDDACHLHLQASGCVWNTHTKLVGMPCTYSCGAICVVQTINTCKGTQTIYTCRPNCDMQAIYTCSLSLSDLTVSV